MYSSLCLLTLLVITQWTFGQSRELHFGICSILTSLKRLDRFVGDKCLWIRMVTRGCHRIQIAIVSTSKVVVKRPLIHRRIGTSSNTSNVGPKLFWFKSPLFLSRSFALRNELRTCSEVLFGNSSAQCVAKMMSNYPSRFEGLFQDWSILLYSLQVIVRISKR